MNSDENYIFLVEDPFNVACICLKATKKTPHCWWSGLRLPGAWIIVLPNIYRVSQNKFSSSVNKTEELTFFLGLPVLFLKKIKASEVMVKAFVFHWVGTFTQTPCMSKSLCWREMLWVTISDHNAYWKLESPWLYLLLSQKMIPWNIMVASVFGALKQMQWSGSNSLPGKTLIGTFIVPKTQRIQSIPTLKVCQWIIFSILCLAMYYPW